MNCNFCNKLLCNCVSLIEANTIVKSLQKKEVIDLSEEYCSICHQDSCTCAETGESDSTTSELSAASHCSSEDSYEPPLLIKSKRIRTEEKEDGFTTPTSGVSYVVPSVKRVKAEGLVEIDHHIRTMGDWHVGALVTYADEYAESMSEDDKFTINKLIQLKCIKSD